MTHREFTTERGTFCANCGESMYAAQAECPAVHLCDNTTMAYVATYGAPGIGQEWKCTVCGRVWAKVGDTFYDPNEGEHILRPEDVR